MARTRGTSTRVGALVAMLALLASATAAAPANGHSERVRAIVVLHDTVDARSTAHQMSQAHDGDLSHVYEHALSGFAGTFPQARLDNMARDPRVDYVELDRQVELEAQTTPTGVRRIFADTNANLDIDGTDDHRVDVDVAIIDTGIDLEHPDLNVAEGVSCLETSGGGPPWSRTYTCAAGGDDDHYHGTHVAGTVGALDNGVGVVGVAPGARVHPVKVLDSSGSGYQSGIVAGIDWVAANAGTIEVANMSLGGSGYSQTEYDAIQGAVDAGVAFAVAAGNDDDDASNYSPAAFDNVLTVSALADFDGAAGGTGSPTCRSDQDDTLADFSNWGSAVDIAAPGVCITSTYPLEQGEYGTISGTSMASPHVAGALALKASTNNPGTATDVKNLYDAVTGAGNFEWTDDSGDGTQEPLLDVSSFHATLVATGDGGGTTDAPPTVAITQPNGDATVSGTVTITADANDVEGMRQVEFFVDDSSIGTDASSEGGWSVDWDTTTATDGDHTITATATDTADQSTTSDPVTVTVDNSSGEEPASGTLTVANETWDQFGGRNSDKHLDVTVRVVDGSGNGVAGATVTIDLLDGDRTRWQAVTATTDSTGAATFSFRDAGPATTCYEADITAVTLDGWDWDRSDPSHCGT